MTAVLAPPRLREIKLYGKTGAQFGRSFRFAVSSPAEAIQALIHQVDGFERHLMEAKSKGFGFAVFIGKRNLSETELDHPPGNEPIRIAPIIFGSKNRGLMSVILGAVLVGAGVFTFGATTAIGGALVSAGVGLAVGGVIQLLFPPPKMGKPKERPENTPSYTFAGPVNTQAQGQPVPLLLGRMIVGSAVVSAGIEAKDEVYVPVGGGGNPGGGGGANQEYRDGSWRWQEQR